MKTPGFVFLPGRVSRRVRFGLAGLFLLLAALLARAAALSPANEPAGTAASTTIGNNTAASTADTASGNETEAATIPESKTALPHGGPLTTVYLVPIHDEISVPQLYILRRALKEAIENHADVVIDMDTLGGEMDVTLDMMDALAKFPGHTYTYVDDKAMSAGSFIADATGEIYFKTGSARIGAAAPVTSEGADIDSTMKLKLDSFMDATVRGITVGKRYRADVQRAMMDPDYELKIDGVVIKPAGTLLTLTGEEACKTYGHPPQKLLGAGLAPDVDTLLSSLYGPHGYILQEFNLTWSEQLAKLINAVAPLLMGLGIFLLLLEFKTPGFGLPGIAGIAILLLVLAGQYVAGLAGYEPAVLFALGIILILLELLFFHGTMVLGLSGVICFFGAFVWAMTDVWPQQQFGGVSMNALTQPLINTGIAILVAGVGFALALRFLPQTGFYGRLVNRASVPRDSVASAAGGAAATGATALPTPGTRGLAVTDLRPLGEIEIAGGRFQARAEHININRGTTVVVIGRRDFALAVEAAKD
jgi:membrane-bound serine protease (ClpP class)